MRRLAPAGPPYHYVLLLAPRRPGRSSSGAWLADIKLVLDEIKVLGLARLLESAAAGSEAALASTMHAALRPHG